MAGMPKLPECVQKCFGCPDYVCTCEDSESTLCYECSEFICPSCTYSMCDLCETEDGACEACVHKCDRSACEKCGDDALVCNSCIKVYKPLFDWVLNKLPDLCGNLHRDDIKDGPDFFPDAYVPKYTCNDCKDETRTKWLTAAREAELRGVIRARREGRPYYPIEERKLLDKIACQQAECDASKAALAAVREKAGVGVGEKRGRGEKGGEEEGKEEKVKRARSEDATF